MPTLDWVNRKAAEEAADRVPYRLLECFGGFGKPSPPIQ
jgi:hypothetical protein